MTLSLHVLCLACKDFIFGPISELASIKELDNSVFLSKTAKNMMIHSLL